MGHEKNSLIMSSKKVRKNGWLEISLKNSD